MNARTDQISNYNPVYDLIRGAAAMTVFFGHVFPFWSSISGIQFKIEIVNAFLFLGVEFFFALSGVLLGPLLYLQFQKEKPFKNVRIFLMRRWYRTLPTYYIGLALWMSLYFSTLSFDNTNTLYSLGQYFLFVQNLFGQDDAFYVVAWSISVEEIFYVVFVAIVGVCFLKSRQAGKSHMLAISMIILFSFVMRVYALQDFSSWDSDIRKASLLRLDSIAIGALIGIFCVNITRRWFCSALLFVLATIYYLSIYWDSIEASAIHNVILQVMFTLLPFACAVFVKYLADNWALKPSGVIRFFADISYPLYIFHLAILPHFFNVGLEPYFYHTGLDISYLLLSAYVIFTIGYCYLFFRYIETPILNQRPRYES